MSAPRTQNEWTQDYLTALSELEDNPENTVSEITQRYTANVQWDRELENNLSRRRTTEYDENYIRKTIYRPFVKTNCYADYTFVNCKYQLDLIFPEGYSDNLVICVPGIGSKKPFSVLMTDTIPDLGLNNAAQCFPRYEYPKPSDTPDASESLLGIEDTPIVLTTYQTQHYAPSVSITTTTQSQRTLSLTMFTAFCMPPVIVSSLPMIYLR